MCDLVCDAVRISPAFPTPLVWFQFLSCAALIMVYVLETNSQCWLNNIRYSQALARLWIMTCSTTVLS